MNKGPLSGITLIEMEGIGPGPCAGMMFADMGANVILVGRKNPNANAAKLSDGEDSHKHTFYNRGKQSIALDLKNPGSIELVLKLVEKADVLIEGYRPGVMERIGLSPQVCQQRNPKLVYGRMTGWGQTGPLAHAAGHDPNYAALSGALWYGARKDQAPSAPLTLTGDIAGGSLMLAWGVLCAVMDAQKTGKGQVIDAAITDGSAYASSLLWMMYHSRHISDHPGSGWPDGATPWNDTYECSDGKFVTICALEPQFYRELLERLNLTDHPLFQEQWNAKHWPAGKAVIKEIFLQQTRDYWCEQLEGTDVCFGPVLNFKEVTEHPHNIARETFLSKDGITQPAPAPKYSDFKPELGDPPRNGEHNDAVLQWAGFDDAAIQAIKDSGAI